MEQVTGNKEQGRGFRSLLAWQKADKLASTVYRTLSKLPPDHRWLAAQVLRAAISVPANIAEGHGRGSLGDYIRFLDIARGSLAEVEYYIHFLEQEGLLPATDVSLMQTAQQETGRVLHGLWRSLKGKADAGGWDRSGRVREDQAAYEPNGALSEVDDRG